MVNVNKPLHGPFANDLFFFLFPLVASLVQSTKERRKNELEPGNEIIHFTAY